MTWCTAFFLLLGFTMMYIFADLWFIPKIKEIRFKAGRQNIKNKEVKKK